MKRTFTGLITAAVITVGLILSACGDSGLEEVLKLNDDPASVLMIVRDEGGFVPIEFIVGQGPRFVLLRDGKLIVPGPQIEIFPQPLVPNYQTVQVDDETMLFVLEELEALGFAEIESDFNDEASGMVADASTSVVTFYNQDGAHTFSVYALGLGTGTTDARVPILANLVDELSQAGFSQQGDAYEWEGLEVIAGVPQVGGEPEFVDVRPWPLDTGFGELTEIGFGWNCAAYDGEEARGLLDLFASASQATTWDDNGTEYTIRVKPQLPGEEPCARVISAG